jgi:diguanylate cyclase (GGDEF)-like protein/PAS domain S-box-containing protein
MSKRDLDIEHANSALDRYNSALNASVSYLMAADGITVASSNRNDPDSFLGKSYRFRPYFQEAAKGQPGRYFALGITSGKRGFYASYPVQDHPGKVLGVVTMKKDLDEMETFFSKYPFCFLVSRDGIIFLSSSPAMVLKSLWPLDKAVRDTLIASREFGNKLSEDVFLKKEITDGTEVTLEGKDYFISRKGIDSDGWSIVLLTPTDRIMIYKLIGILATISVCFLIMVFLGIIYVKDQSQEAIRQSEELYKALTEKSIAGVYVVQDGKFRFINSKAASYAGYTREELLGQEANILVSPEDIEKVRQNARAMLLGKESSPYEFRIITKQGETHWIMETVTSILHEGKPAILGNSMDITKRKRAEEALQENRSRLEDIVTFLPDATLAIDKEKRTIIWNKAIEKMTGIPAAEMIGKGDYAYTIPFYGEARPQLMDLVFLDHNEIATRYPNITREGDSLTAEAFCNALYNNKGAWVFAKASPLHDQSGNIIGAIESIRDITEHKRMEEEILALSITDQLTGLHNRRGFLSLAGQQLKLSDRNKRGVQLYFADLDGLKWINDTLGHEEGDRALIESATLFKETFRTSDIIARLGGDEYAALAIDITEENSEIFTARLQSLIDTQNNQDDRRYRLSISVGCSYYDPENPCSLDELMARADKLMYEQKQNKKGLLPQGASLAKERNKEN